MGEGLATRRGRAVACGLPGGGGASRAARMASGSDLPDLSDPREIFPGMSDPREIFCGKNLRGKFPPRFGFGDFPVLFPFVEAVRSDRSDRSDRSERSERSEGI